MKTKYMINFNQRIKLKKKSKLLKNIKGFKIYPKIKRIRIEIKWKKYNQFQLKDKIKINQNLYYRNKDHTK